MSIQFKKLILMTYVSEIANFCRVAFPPFQIKSIYYDLICNFKYINKLLFLLQVFHQQWAQPKRGLVWAQVLQIVARAANPHRSF